MFILIFIIITTTIMFTITIIITFINKKHPSIKNIKLDPIRAIYHYNTPSNKELKRITLNY